MRDYLVPLFFGGDYDRRNKSRAIGQKVLELFGGIGDIRKASNLFLKVKIITKVI